MSKDNPRKKKADGKRVALLQGYEREYVAEKMDEVAAKLLVEAQRLANVAQRLRAGFPKARRK